MNMVSMSISKKEERQRCLPLEIRMKMYDDVHKLRKEGLSYRQIQKRVYEKYGKRLPTSTISCWINRKHNPLKNVNKFDGRPSPELAYVIGTILSDGYKHFDGNKRNYCLRLEVNDYEFAEEFGKCLAKVLKRRKPYKPFWNENKKLWIAQGCTFLLYKFLNKPLEELKPYIEHSKYTISAFLRALFDGEGSACKRDFRLYNTNIEMLNYAKYLLKKCFDINVTGPILEKKSGLVRYFLNSRRYKTTKNCYYLYIHTRSLLNFYENIGFTIKRKQQRLIKAIKQ